MIKVCELFAGVGGFRLGYAKTRDLIFSQTLALGFANIIVFIETIIARKVILPVGGFLGYYAVEIVLTVIINFIANKIYYFIFPARKTILIYGEDYSSIYEQIMRYQAKAYNIEKEITYDGPIKNLSPPLERKRVPQKRIEKITSS